MNKALPTVIVLIGHSLIKSRGEISAEIFSLVTTTSITMGKDHGIVNKVDAK